MTDITDATIATLLEKQHADLLARDHEGIPLITIDHDKRIIFTDIRPAKEQKTMQDELAIIDRQHQIRLAATRWLLDPSNRTHARGGIRFDSAQVDPATGQVRRYIPGAF